jgi:hypothetical protein
MNPTKTILILLTVIAISALAANNANANRFAYDVNYDLIVQHSRDLECVAADLKDCYRDNFRYSPLYGKLNSRTSRIKSLARRLNRHGDSRGSCNWNNEINRMDELVCELRDYTSEAIYRNRFARPICSSGIRKIRKLLAKTEFHVTHLKRALIASPTPVCNEPPVFHRPRYNQPAPAYTPRGTDFGHSAGRGIYNYHPHRNSFNDIYRARQLSDYRSGSPGFTFDVGGLQFHVNR